MAREALMVAAVVLPALLAAAPALAASEVVVEVSNYQFTPNDVQIVGGDSVRWTWVSGTHSVRAGTPSAPGDLWCGTRSGGDCVRTFTTDGTFPYYCTVHTSMQAQVVVGTPAVPPSITIASPSDGDLVTGTFTASGTAGDDVGLDRVEVRLGSKPWVVASGTASWTANLDTAGLYDGTYALTARAYDVEGAVADDVVDVVVDVPDFHDLRLANLFVRDAALASGSVRLTAYVANDGTVPDTASVLFEYRYQDAWHPIGSRSLSLQPGHLGVVYVDWSEPTKIGAFPVRATVDPQDTVDEVDETDNTRTATAGFVTRAIEGRDLRDT